MKKEYIKPTTEVIVLGTGEFCEEIGVFGGSGVTPESFEDLGKGTSTWEDDNDWED